MIHSRRFNGESAPLPISLEEVTCRVRFSVTSPDFDKIPAMFSLGHILVYILVITVLVLIFGVDGKVVVGGGGRRGGVGGGGGPRIKRR